ncbi:Protein SPT2 [Trebouxia sp. C0009 RCD-2024]
MSSAVQDQRSSAGLESRPSFFGGFVSTRKASALPTWQPAKPSQSLTQSRPGQNDKLKAPAGSKERPCTQVKAAPAPPPDPIVLRKQQLKANRNFDSDSETEAEKSKPRAYNLQQLTQLEQKLSAAERAAAAKRPASKPYHVQQAQQQQPNAYKSPFNQVASKGTTPTRTIAPKGKAGAASRSMALAPQAIGLSRKQMADRGMRKAVDSVRGQGLTPAAARPSPQAAPTSSHSRPAGTANRGPSSMPSTSGRPMPPSAPPSRAPPSRVPPQHNPSKQSAHARPAAAADALRHPAQGMPAWMQKAKQAVLAGRGAKRVRHEEDDYDDFVVDDEEEPDWRQALKSVTRYDPSKFDDRGFDDRSMEASYKQIQAEERRSARMGREDDLRAEEEELKMQEEKRKKKKRAKGSSGLVM